MVLRPNMLLVVDNIGLESIRLLRSRLNEGINVAAKDVDS